MICDVATLYSNKVGKEVAVKGQVGLFLIVSCLF